MGGRVIASSGNYRSLFVIDGISFAIFFAIIYVAIAETYQFKSGSTASQDNGWSVALRDRALMVFVAVNIFIYNLPVSGADYYAVILEKLCSRITNGCRLL